MSDKRQALEQLQQIENALEKLPCMERTALLMAARDHRLYADIGRELGISARRVEKLIARALAALDRELTEE